MAHDARHRSWARCARLPLCQGTPSSGLALPCKHVQSSLRRQDEQNAASKHKGIVMKRCKYLPATIVGALVGVAGAAPYPHHATPAAIDMGEAAAVAGNAQMTVTVALKLSNEEQLEPLLESIYRQGSPLYHQFLTPERFRARFGPSAETIASLTRYFEAAGLQVTRAATAQLRVSGSAAAVEHA